MERKAIMFAANGKVWSVIPSVPLNPQEELVKSAFTEMAEHIDLEVGYVKETHDRRGIHYRLCRLPDSLVPWVEKAEVERLESLLKA
jgi:hypothetical protein